MASETIRIIVTSSGTVTVQRQITDLGESAKKSGAAVNTLKSALTTLVTAGAIGTLVHYGDQFNEIQNRLKLVTKGTDELNTVTQKLTGIANSTYTSLSGVATVYQRVEQATGKLGLTQQQTLDFTQQFSQAVALSGASAQTADQAITQFTQGLGSGVLRGQDLRSVLDGLPAVTSALAAGLGTDIAGLRAMAEQGVLTPKQIIDAFAKVAPNIANDFAKVKPTISQALQVLDNQLTVAAGKASGAFSLAAEGIIFFATHLEGIIEILSPLIAALTVLAVKTLSTLVYNAAIEAGTAIAGVATALWGATTAAYAFTTALLTNPLTWIVLAAAAAAAGIAALVLRIIDGVDWWQKFVAAVKNDWANVVYYFNKIKEALFGPADASSGTGLPGGGKGINDLPTGAGSAGSGKSSSNPNLSASDVTANQAAAVAASAVALKTNISGGFATGLDLLNSTQENSFQSGADVVGKSITDAFDKGSTSVGSAIDTSFSNATQTGSAGSVSGGPDISGSWEDYMKSVQAWSDNWVATQGYNHSSGSGSNSFANLNNQTPGSSQGFHAFASGGSFRVGGAGGTDSQTVAFRASPNERVTIETPEQQARRGSDNNNTPAKIPAPVVNNVLDAKSLLLALDTNAGRTTMYNTMKFNQEQFREALGL